ncbi:hypothetical protein [Legionella yabuuchiae]|uniref:hypothetical protein n=1 Tax=Legionella yabuuchiae TaxID=376727 RepID=UPI00105691B5|nr:hypothetical protein [Legionella yabuuchiae]
MSSFNKQMFYKSTRFLGYGFAFVGIFIAANAYGTGNLQDAIRMFAFVGIAPLAFCAFLWHTIGQGHLIETSESPFFEVECGGANLGISIGLLLAWLLHASTETIRYLLLVYFIYLLVSAISHWLYRGFRKMLHFLPLLFAMLFFISLH